METMYLTVAIPLGILALLMIVTFTMIGIQTLCRSVSQPADQSYQNSERRSQNTIQNRSSYFSIGSSSSENFSEDNLEEQTPIIRPRLRTSNIQQ